MFLERQQQAQGAKGEESRENSRNWAPSRQNPQRPQTSSSPCIISETVNMMDFAPMIRLYYTMQLTFRKKDYPNRADLITQAF